MPTRLNLLDDGRPTNAAILLFGKFPQRFTLPSEVIVVDLTLRALKADR